MRCTTTATGIKKSLYFVFPYPTKKISLTFSEQNMQKLKISLFKNSCEIIVRYQTIRNLLQYTQIYELKYE